MNRWIIRDSNNVRWLSIIRKSYRTHPWVSFDDAKNLEHHVYSTEIDRSFDVKSGILSGGGGGTLTYSPIQFDLAQCGCRQEWLTPHPLFAPPPTWLDPLQPDLFRTDMKLFRSRVVLKTKSTLEFQPVDSTLKLKTYFDPDCREAPAKLVLNISSRVSVGCSKIRGSIPFWLEMFASQYTQPFNTDLFLYWRHTKGDMMQTITTTETI